MNAIISYYFQANFFRQKKGIDLIMILQSVLKQNETSLIVLFKKVLRNLLKTVILK